MPTLLTVLAVLAILAISGCAGHFFGRQVNTTTIGGLKFAFVFWSLLVCLTAGGLFTALAGLVCGFGFTIGTGMLTGLAGGLAGLVIGYLRD